jgi:hypothetical protein
MATKKIISVKPRCPKCKTVFTVEEIHVDFIHCDYILQLSCLNCGEEVSLPLGLEAFINLQIGGQNERGSLPHL